MVRISDARMSGTAYGTVVLHVCPEAAVGGPLALVHSGDMITLNVPAKSLRLEVTKKRSRGGPRNGILPFFRSAVGNVCMLSTSCRQIKERTWTFWWGVAGRG
jgi:Dehydratase family